MGKCGLNFDCNSSSAVVSRAGSGIRELTNQSRLSIQEAGLKGSVSDRGGTQSCCTGQYEITDVFFETYSSSNPKQNYEPENEPNMSLSNPVCSSITCTDDRHALHLLEESWDGGVFAGVQSKVVYP